MQSLDTALSAAFAEFRRNRPVRKNVTRLPKDATALMHFRLRCLDLVQALAEKEIAIHLAVSSILPLFSLLEATAKEPLQKPLMDRTRYFLLALWSRLTWNSCAGIDLPRSFSNFFLSCQGWC